MMLLQRKALAEGRIHTWDLDLEAMAACVPRGARQLELVQEEVQGILEVFPSFIAVLGKQLPEDQSWVEAMEAGRCEACGDFIVFERGIRCVGCQREVRLPENARTGLVGRIPALISGRPFDDSFQRRLGLLSRQDPERAALQQRCLLEVSGRRYLAPRFGVWFSSHWPHSDPPVMVWPEYFPVLDIPPDHVYYAGPLFRLCLFASWREQPMVEVMQNRLVPRLLIDLMVADLAAVGRLEQALEELDCTLYQLYNRIGRPGEVEGFKAVFERLVRR